MNLLARKILWSDCADFFCTFGTYLLPAEINKIICFMAENTRGNIFPEYDLVSSCKYFNLAVFTCYIKFFSDFDRENNSSCDINVSYDTDIYDRKTGFSFISYIIPLFTILVNTIHQKNKQPQKRLPFFTVKDDYLIKPVTNSIILLRIS